MKDRETIEFILNAISLRPDLMQRFADILGMPASKLSKWINKCPVPEELPAKLFAVCKHIRIRRVNYAVLLSIHTTQDRAEAAIDRLVELKGQDEYIIIDSPLNP